MDFAALCTLPDTQDADRGREEACLTRLEAAEAQGYAAVWLRDAPSRAGLASALHLVAAGLSARTTRIRIGTTATLAPSLHPLRLAEEIAMLDVMTGGRLDWALSPPAGSAEHPRMEHTLQVFGEQVEVTLRALSGARFSHEGDFFRVPELQCFPTPLQTPHPPLWIRADSDAAQQWAVAEGHAVMADAFAPTAALERAMPRGATGERDTNTSGAAGGRLVVRHVHVAATDAQARADAGPTLAAMHAARGSLELTQDSLLDQCAIVGDAARCRDKLAELAERVRPEGLVAWHGFGTLSHEAALDSQRRLIDEVAPAFA